MGGKVSDTVPGITPPRERIATLRQLAKQAGKTKAEERARLSGEVAAMYQGESDPLVRLEVVRTLGSLPEAAEATFRQAAKDPDADVRVAVCQALGKRKGPVALEVLRERLAGDTDMDVRLAAAKALGEIRDPASVEALGAALQERDPAIQYHAVCSLRKVAPTDLGNDVERWRQYVRDGAIAPSRPVSLADRFHSFFR